MGKRRTSDNSVCRNRKASFRFEILETLECGLVLRGTEVKSLRERACTLEEAYARLEGGELWLVGCDIAEYTQANQFNHDPKRRRKLLLHRREILKFAAQAHEKGITLTPLKMYFKNGRAKVLMGLCKGKKQHDKRESMKKADMNRDIDREMRRRS